MKQLGAMVTSCVLALTMTACSSAPAQTNSETVYTGSGSAPVAPHTANTDTAAQNNYASGSSTQTDDPNTRNYGDCTITLQSYSIRLDNEGQPALRVSFLFTNHSSKPASFSTTVIPNAFQNDTEETLDYAIPAESDIEYSHMLTLVDQEESILCAGYFRLDDTEAPVTIKINDLRDSKAKPLCRMLDIAGMETEEYSDAKETSGSGEQEETGDTQTDEPTEQSGDAQTDEPTESDDASAQADPPAEE